MNTARRIKACPPTRCSFAFRRQVCFNYLIYICHYTIIVSLKYNDNQFLNKILSIVPVLDESSIRLNRIWLNTPLKFTCVGVVGLLIVTVSISNQVLEATSSNVPCTVTSP